MQVRVFRQKEIKGPFQYLRLRQSGEGVVMEACNEDGTAIPRCRLLYISADGVHFYPDINELLGFDLDSKGELTGLTDVLPTEEAG